MSLGVYYIKEFDVLMIKIMDCHHTDYLRKSNVSLIYNESNLIGVNIFDASNHFKKLSPGLLLENKEEILENARLVLKEYNIHLKEDYNDFVVGQVESIEKHPKSDHLSVLKVNVGSDVLQVVCGAKSIEHKRYLFALKGAFLKDGSTLKQGTLLGIKSDAMAVSKLDLNISDAKGLIEVNELPIGSRYFGMGK